MPGDHASTIFATPSLTNDDRLDRTGKEPAREMIRLTTYLGHTSPEDTFWYLEAVPERLDLAMARATSKCGEADQ